MTVGIVAFCFHFSLLSYGLHLLLIIVCVFLNRRYA